MCFVKNIRIQILTSAMVFAFGANMALADFTFSGSGAIPDGNPVGLSSIGTVSGLPTYPYRVAAVSVMLDVSGVPSYGGFNGDLYAYLVGPDSSTRVDLIGSAAGDGTFSKAGSGMQITLSDSASQSYQNAVQTGGALFTGTYRPVVSLGKFIGLPSNGTWRLYIEDQSKGSVSTLNSWSLAISTASVPEPDQVAAMGLLGLMGLVAAGKGVVRKRKLENGK